MLRFRNVEVEQDAPVATWPYEALVTAIERGDITVWRKIAAAIREDPWGYVARSVLQYAGYADPDGIVSLLQRAVLRARKAAERHENDHVAATVRRYVAESGLSRKDFAEAIGTSASRLSTYCTGNVVPSATLMLRMARVAGSDPERCDECAPQPARARMRP